MGPFTLVQINAGLIITLAGTGSCNTLDSLLDCPNQAYAYILFTNTSVTYPPTGCESLIPNSQGSDATNPRHPNRLAEPASPSPPPPSPPPPSPYPPPQSPPPSPVPPSPPPSPPPP
ncbi:hypothetical protein V8C86DRAFT_2560886 [Haematococcus lacustris]